MSDFPIFVLNEKVINAGDMTGNLSSAVIDLAETVGFCMHAIYTGTPTGSLVCSASNDGVNFAAIDTTAISAPGQRLINQEHSHFRYVKVTYTAASSTGVLTVYISGKRQ